jgi:CheY-like chemotaxis protein
VRDKGIGIAESDQTKIFDPFFSTKTAGKGLGLAAVLGIARSHQGFVELESQVGVGTCFSLWLPAAPALVPEGTTSGETMGSEAARTTVLVVDDEAATVRIVKRILEREGYRVLEAATVSAALSLLADAANPIDLVFTDLRLPDGSGRDVIAAAAERDAKLPVILTSGASDGLSTSGEHTPSLVGFLGKPYAPSQLREAIRQALPPVRKS